MSDSGLPLIVKGLLPACYLHSAVKAWQQGCHVNPAKTGVD